MSKTIYNYRTFRREKEHEFDKLTKGYVVGEDKEFESMCDGYLSNDIKISDINTYLNKSLLLDINKSKLNEYFDESGNLIDYNLINESWFKDIIDNVKDKAKATFNVVTTFFKSIVDKVKTFIKKLFSKFSKSPEKMMNLLCSFFEKVMSGLKSFGGFIKKKKKGLYSLLIKISVSLGITATVSYLLSFFGAGWVVGMGTKTSASALSRKFKLGDKATDVINKKKEEEEEEEEIKKVEKVIHNYTQFINETETVQPKNGSSGSKIKKVAISLGKGMIKFFKILRKFRVAILIFLGAIWILGHMFSPFGNFLDPIFEVTKMSKFSDIFDDGFEAASSTIPNVNIDGDQITDINIHKVEMSGLRDEYDIGVDDIQSSSTTQLNMQSSGIKDIITEHPKEFCEDQAKLVNELKSQLGGEELGIDGANVEGSIELTQYQIEETTGEDVSDMIEGDDSFGISEDDIPSNKFMGIRLGKVKTDNDVWDKLVDQKADLNDLYQNGEYDKIKEILVKDGFLIKGDDDNFYNVSSGARVIYPDVDHPDVQGGMSFLNPEGEESFIPTGSSIMPDVLVDNESKLITIKNIKNGTEYFTKGSSDIIFTTDESGIYAGRTQMIFRIEMIENDKTHYHKFISFGDGLLEDTPKGAFKVDPDKLEKLIQKLHPDKIEVFKKMIEQKI